MFSVVGIFFSGLIHCKNMQKKQTFVAVPNVVSRLGGILGWGRRPPFKTNK